MVLHEVAAEIDSRRPGRPWILIAGIVASLMVIFTGVMISLKAGEEAPPSPDSGDHVEPDIRTNPTQPKHDGPTKKNSCIP